MKRLGRPVNYAYADEDNAAVWGVISASLGDIKAVMGTEELREAMKPYIRKLTSKQVERLGWKAKKDESHFDSLLRPIVLGMASAGENQEVVERALKLFKVMHDPDDIPADLQSVGSRMELKNDSIDPDIRGVVYGTVSRHGDDKTFKKLRKLHKESTNSEEQQNLAAALTGFKEPHLIKQALAMITTDDVRLQDVSHWIAYSFVNHYSSRFAWEWLQENWSWLEKNLGTDMVFSRLPLYAARTDITSQFLAEYKKFFTKHSSPALERSIKQGIEMIEWRSAWFERDHKEVLAFFKAQN